MNYIDDVLAEYIKSNAQQRLELYLQYKDLRTNFDLIENKETIQHKESSRQIVIEPEKKEIKQSLFTKLKNGCLAIFS